MIAGKLLHTVMALALTAGMGLMFDLSWVGAAASCAYFAGREIAQAEYRWIERHGAGLRANMAPMAIWTTPGIWSEKSWLWDAALPAAVALALAAWGPSAAWLADAMRLLTWAS